MSESNSNFDGIDRKTGATGLRAFFKIADKWSLTEDEQRKLLGDIPASLYCRWRSSKGEEISLDENTLERLSYLIGIYRALHTLFADQEVADNWLRWPSENVSFEGKSPLDRIW